MPETLQQAVMLIQMGEPERARILLQQTVEFDPSCLDAWLWLSELADTLEEQTSMLDEALKRIPAESTKTLQDYLIEIHGSLPLPAPSALEQLREQSGPFRPEISATEDAYQQASRLALLGQRAEALQKLQGLVSEGAQSEGAQSEGAQSEGAQSKGAHSEGAHSEGAQEARIWWLISELEPLLEDKIDALRQALAIEPDHAEAAERLRALEPLRDDPLQAASFLESIGEAEQALDLYRLLAAQATDIVARRALEQRIAQLEIAVTQWDQIEQGKRPAKSIFALARSLFSRSA